jgi:hypothetical protein
MRELCDAATSFGSAALALASECLINMRSKLIENRLPLLTLYELPFPLSSKSKRH